MSGLEFDMSWNHSCGTLQAKEGNMQPKVRESLILHRGNVQSIRFTINPLSVQSV